MKNSFGGHNFIFRGLQYIEASLILQYNNNYTVMINDALVYHIIVTLMQYCQKWSRIVKKIRGQNGGNLWEQEREKLEQNPYLA